MSWYRKAQEEAAEEDELSSAVQEVMSGNKASLLARREGKKIFVSVKALKEMLHMFGLELVGHGPSSPDYELWFHAMSEVDGAPIDDKVPSLFNALSGVPFMSRLDYNFAKEDETVDWRKSVSFALAFPVQAEYEAWAPGYAKKLAVTAQDDNILEEAVEEHSRGGPPLLFTERGGVLFINPVLVRRLFSDNGLEVARMKTVTSRSELMVYIKEDGRSDEEMWEAIWKVCRIMNSNEAVKEAHPAAAGGKAASVHFRQPVYEDTPPKYASVVTAQDEDILGDAALEAMDPSRKTPRARALKAYVRKAWGALEKLEAEGKARGPAVRALYESIKFRDEARDLLSVSDPEWDMFDKLQKSWLWNEVFEETQYFFGKDMSHLFPQGVTVESMASFFGMSREEMVKAMVDRIGDAYGSWRADLSYFGRFFIPPEKHLDFWKPILPLVAGRAKVDIYGQGYVMSEPASAFGYIPELLQFPEVREAAKEGFRLRTERLKEKGLLDSTDLRLYTNMINSNDPYLRDFAEEAGLAAQVQDIKSKWEIKDVTISSSLGWNERYSWIRGTNAKSLESLTEDQWEEVSKRMIGLGYDYRGGADAKKIFLTIVNGGGKLNGDMARAIKAVTGGPDYAREPDQKSSERAFERAKKFFGLTDSFAEAGYILPDGSLLDFSGRAYGGIGGSRGIDHRDMNQIVDWQTFISMGAIRYFPEVPGVDIRKRPTRAQMDMIAASAQDSSGGYLVRITDPLRGRINKEYPPGTAGREVVGAINEFYETGLGQPT